MRASPYPTWNAYFAAQFTLSEWFPMINAYFFIFLGAALIGMIFGFVLLEEKDHNTIKALLVSPLPTNHYVAYRVGMSMLIAFVQITLAILITGVALPQFWQLLLISAGATLTAPLAALYLSTFGENKVQGLALLKFISAAGFIIPLAWFVPEPLQFLFGLFPPYWVSKAYWLALDGNPLWLGSLALGIVLQILAIMALTRRFKNVIYLNP